MTEQTEGAEVEALETEVVETLDPNGYGWAAGDGPGMASILRTVLASDWLAAREAAAEARGAEREREAFVEELLNGATLDEHDARVAAAAEVRGAQAVLTAVEALHSGWHLCEDGMAGERWNDPLECDYKVEDPCETLNAARAAAAAAGGGGEG